MVCVLETGSSHPAVTRVSILCFVRHLTFSCPSPGDSVGK